MGDQQGTLLALLGSDAPQLADGNAVLDTLIADHPDHPLAVYALMAKGTNAGRDFLTLTPEGVDVRAADTYGAMPLSLATLMKRPRRPPAYGAIRRPALGQWAHGHLTKRPQLRGCHS